MTPRRFVRQIALVLTLVAAAWATLLTVTGGFDLAIGGVTLASHEPLRPLFWGSLTLAAFVWANGVSPTAASWLRVFRRINCGAVVAVLVIWTMILGVRYAATVASAADAYGYISQADLWIAGDLKVPQPWVADVPWPDAKWSFTPLGYRPIEQEDNWNLVPIYSPGMPMMMAALKRLAGQAAMFVIVPITGGLLVLTTYGIGRRLGAPVAGAIAAWLVATSPTYLFMLALPMIDVPVATLWTLSFYVLLRPGASAALVGGATAALAILVRPNLAPLVAALAIGLAFGLSASGLEPRRARVVRAIVFSAAAALGALAIALIYRNLYGSPFRSGYGSLEVLFAWRYVLPNLRNYFGWMIETQTVLAVAGLASLFLPWPSIWPGLANRRVLATAALFIIVLWAEYCVYLPFDSWWFLRFLLPSWPLIFVGLASVLVAVARARSSLGIVVVTWLVVVLGAYTLRVGEQRGAFTLWKTERAYVAAAQHTAALTAEKSVVFTLLHSGSVRYYGGRMTMRFDLLDKAWLDKAVAWLAERGVHAYALLDGPEVQHFKTRFADQATTRRLDDPPMFSFGGPPSIRLFDLGAPGVAAPPVAVDFRQLRSVPPVAQPGPVWRK